MLQVFVQSLLLGAAILTVALLACRVLMRENPRQKITALPAGQDLRCIRPLDLSER